MAPTYPPYLHAVHDQEGASLVDGIPGWVVVSEEVGSDPNDHSGRDYGPLKAKGLGVVVRLNFNHHGQGTIPDKLHYRDFANRCANFVAASSGIDVAIIGNEPNCEGEWIVIGDKRIPIDPLDYARCYSECLFAIHGLRKQIPVLVAALAPWNNQSGDWLMYLRRLINNINPCDGFALHAYTHGPDPALITSEDMQHGWHWHFRVYRDQMDVINELIPAKVALFIGITETDQNDPWLDVDSGWCVAAAQEIHGYSQTAQRPISLLAFYRGGPWDRWSFAKKDNVRADIRKAVELRLPTTLPAKTDTPMPTPPTPAPDDGYLVEWDTRLDERGTMLGVAQGAPQGPGDSAWHVTHGRWYDEGEAQGRVNVFVTVLDEQGQLVVGVPVRWFWEDDDEVKQTEVKHDPWLGHDYSLDFAMYTTAPAYGVQIDGDLPSDIVQGMGLGDIARPGMKIHTSYAFTFQRLANTAPQPPKPTPPPINTGALILPVKGTRTQRFGQNPQDYARFNIPGHNGTDWAAPAGTPVVATADGIVKFVGFDQDYGFYARVFHPQFGFHSFMAHLLRQPDLSPGAQVKQGQLLGLVGTTGNSSGSHLHFEIRLGSENDYAEGQAGYGKGRVDPETVLSLLSG